MGGLFVLLAWRLWRTTAASGRAKQLFGFSILYLFVLFAFLIVDRGSGAGLVSARPMRTSRTSPGTPERRLRPEPGAGALALVGFVVVIYFVSLVRMGGI